nr:MAG TPA: hypothetical protein [Caudoviricetes sp.]
MNRKSLKFYFLLISILNVNGNIYIQYMHTRTPYILYYNTLARTRIIYCIYGKKA